MLATSGLAVRGHEPALFLGPDFAEFIPLLAGFQVFEVLNLTQLFLPRFSQRLVHEGLKRLQVTGACCIPGCDEFLDNRPPRNPVWEQRVPRETRPASGCARIQWDKLAGPGN